jgi:hypothetical protein
MEDEKENDHPANSLPYHTDRRVPSDHEIWRNFGAKYEYWQISLKNKAPFDWLNGQLVH